MNEFQSPFEGLEDSLVYKTAVVLDDFLIKGKTETVAAGNKVHDLLANIRNIKSAAPDKAVIQVETPAAAKQLMERPEVREHMITYTGYMEELARKCYGTLCVNTILKEVSNPFPENSDEATKIATDAFSLLLGDNGLISQTRQQLRNISDWSKKSQEGGPDLFQASNTYIAALSKGGQDELVVLAKKNHVDFPGVRISDGKATVGIGTFDLLQMARTLKNRQQGKQDLTEKGLFFAFCFLQGSPQGVNKIVDFVENVAKPEHHF